MDSLSLTENIWTYESQALQPAHHRGLHWVDPWKIVHIKTAVRGNMERFSQTRSQIRGLLCIKIKGWMIAQNKLLALFVYTVN